MIKEVFFQNKNFKDLNPLGVGCERCPAGYSCGPEVRHNYWIHYIISGRGIYETESKTYNLTGGQAFIIPQGKKIFFRADDEQPWEYTWIGFNGEYAEKLDRLKSPILNIDYSYFEDLLSCQNYPNMEADFLAGKLFMIFSHIFTRQYPGNYIKFVTDYISSYYSQSVRVHEIADILGLNPNYLSSLFKSETGQTIRDYLMSIRMNKAMAIINNQHYNVTTVASMVGYSDIYAFSKHFKKRFGHSPKYFINKTI